MKLVKGITFRSVNHINILELQQFSPASSVVTVPTI